MFLFMPLGYWLVIGLCTLLSLWAAAMTKGAFARYSRERTRAGLTGAQVAQRILRDNGIHDVRIEQVAGNLTDHYDPRSKTLRLSSKVYHSDSMAAVGVAAHEVGHAIQHAHSYGPLNFRSAWVPVANAGSGLSFILLIAAMAFGGAATALGATFSWIAVGAFAVTTVFTLVTLPVEFDASKRALATLENGNYVTPDELRGARKVLNAAAMTYVAAFVSSLLVMLYWAWQLGLIGGRRND